MIVNLSDDHPECLPVMVVTMDREGRATDMKTSSGSLLYPSLLGRSVKLTNWRVDLGI